MCLSLYARLRAWFVGRRIQREQAAALANGEVIPALNHADLETMISGLGLDRDAAMAIAAEVFGDEDEPLPEPPSPPEEPTLVEWNGSVSSSDGEGLGWVFTRGGRRECYAVRPLSSRVTGVRWVDRWVAPRRAILMGKGATEVIGGVTLRSSDEVVPQHPIMPIARTPEGPVHSCEPRVCDAVRFLYG